MKIEKISKTILAIMSLLMLNANQVLADTQANLVFKTSIPKAANIQKTLSRSVVYANPETGEIQGSLNTSFDVEVNDDDTEFVVTSSITTTEGTSPAYDSVGNLLFANISNPPTAADVSQALLHNGQNNNVIVYPVNIETTSPLTSTFRTEYKEFGNCYVINMAGGLSGTVTHNVASTPIAGTFSKTRDTAGTYRATITITTSEI